MNQKGETTLLCILLLTILMGIVLLCSLELKKSLRLLERRANLFLCVKETKGELHQYLVFMGRSNWGVKNIERAGAIMIFVPGLQGIAANAKKAKRLIQKLQEAKTMTFSRALISLMKRGCPLDPRMLKTPFKLGAGLLQRDPEGAAILREKKWTYHYSASPSLLSLEVDANGMEKARPVLTYLSSERQGKSSFPFW